MERLDKWLIAAKPVLLLVGRALAPVVLGMLTGLLLDAGLLDQQLGDALHLALQPSGS